MKLQLLTALCLLNLYAEGSIKRSNINISMLPYGHHNNHFWHRKTNERLLTKEYVTSQNDYSDPPDHTKLVQMARYVMHVSDWASIATISTLEDISGFPFNNVKSVVDGPENNSTGTPYFYMSPLDFTAKDLTNNPRATVLLSLEESNYCKKMEYDPEDPRCTRLMLSGIIKKLQKETPEYVFAQRALFERHPEMADFPPDHDWFISKLKIVKIAMVDWFGGAKFIDVKDYLNYDYPGTELLEEMLMPSTKNFDLTNKYKVTNV